MKIYSIEVFNLGSIGTFCGEAVPKGCLGVVVDNYRFDAYQELPGGIFYSECDGLLSIYHHLPGSTDGFAGRAITLPVIERSILSSNIKARRLRTFKGSLWASASAKNQVESHLGQRLTNLGVKSSSDRHGVYSSVIATEKFMERLAKVVVLGSPDSSPLL